MVTWACFLSNSHGAGINEEEGFYKLGPQNVKMYFKDINVI